MLNYASPEGDAFTFRSTKPIAGVSEITVTNFDAKTIRVTVTGEAKLPTVELFDSPNEGLIFGVASTAPVVQQVQPQTQQPQTQRSESQTQPTKPSSQSNEPIELLVTGEQNGYRVPDASTATGTNTPILETPFSVQVIPQDVIRDQQAIQAKDAVRNISGVTYNGDVTGRSGDTFSIRGFSNAPVLIDGIRRFSSTGEGNSQLTAEIAGLERIEVLKGPSSILYGAIEPGGLINLISKKPLANPFYELELQAGNRGLVRPRFDVSGPLSEDGKLLYRLNGLYQNYSSFKDYTQPYRRYFIAPTISWKIGDRTDLNFSFNYVDDKKPADNGVPASGTSVANVKRNRIIDSPDDAVTTQTLYTGYNLEHRFNDHKTIRPAF